MDFGLSYSELITIESFGDRLKYLSLWDKGYVSPRFMSNPFYKSSPWLTFREEIKIRDLGCDLGLIDFDIDGPIIIHHINPLVQEDFDDYNVEKLLNPENVITTSYDTHNKIHYKQKHIEVIERQPGDTKLW